LAINLSVYNWIVCSFGCRSSVWKL